MKFSYNNKRFGDVGGTFIDEDGAFRWVSWEEVDEIPQKEEKQDDSYEK